MINFKIRLKKPTLLSFLYGVFMLSFVLTFIEEVNKNPNKMDTYVSFSFIFLILIYIRKMLKTKTEVKTNLKISKKNIIKNKKFLYGIGFFVLIILLDAPILFIPFLIISTLFILISNGVKRKQRNTILKSGINKIDLINGEEFEKYLEELFFKKGYKVERTPISGDYGADLIIEKDGSRTAIQAKRYSDKVGLHAVQEIVAAKVHYNCENGMVVTNNYFTQQAQNLAKSNNIILWNRDELIKEILSL